MAVVEDAEFREVMRGVENNGARLIVSLVSLDRVRNNDVMRQFNNVAAKFEHSRLRIANTIEDIAALRTCREIDRWIASLGETGLLIVTGKTEVAKNGLDTKKTEHSVMIGVDAKGNFRRRTDLGPDALGYLVLVPENGRVQGIALRNQEQGFS
jgi:hypothetical protein